MISTIYYFFADMQTYTVFYLSNRHNPFI